MARPSLALVLNTVNEGRRDCRKEVLLALELAKESLLLLLLLCHWRDADALGETKYGFIAFGVK